MFSESIRRLDRHSEETSHLPSHFRDSLTQRYRESYQIRPQGLITAAGGRQPRFTPFAEAEPKAGFGPQNPRAESAVPPTLIPAWGCSCDRMSTHRSRSCIAFPASLVPGGF